MLHIRETLFLGGYMYTITPFVWHQVDEGTIIQTQHSITLIQDIKLQNFMQEQEMLQKTHFDALEIKQRFGSESEQVIDFLLDNKLIKKKAEMKLEFQRLIVVSQENKFIELVKQIWGEEYTVIGCDFDFLEKIEIRVTDLILGFVMPFSIDELEILRNTADECDAYLKVLFPYDGKMYISNFYRKSWANPCPVCFFSEIECQLRGEAGEYSINFQTLMDLIYKKNPEFTYEIPLRGSDYLKIAYAISTHLSGDLTEKEINEVLEMELATGKIRRDISYHWGYCDCYE